MARRALFVAAVMFILSASPGTGQEYQRPKVPSDFENVMTVPFPDYIRDAMPRLYCGIIGVYYTYLTDPFKVPRENVFPDAECPEGVICGDAVLVRIIEASCPEHCQLPPEAVNRKETVNIPNRVPEGVSRLVFAHLYTYIDFPPPGEGRHPKLKCVPKDR